MKFAKKIFLEQAIKYVITFIVVALLWGPCKNGLDNAAASGNLEAIAVIMGIVSLCALTGYFAFSYTTVGKSPTQRFF